MKRKRETVKQYLARGGKVTKCPPGAACQRPWVTRRLIGHWLSPLAGDGCKRRQASRLSA